MVIFYMKCGACFEQGRLVASEGFTLAADQSTDWLDRESIGDGGPSECMWFVPGCPPAED
jgi:hypothetical protein